MMVAFKKIVITSQEGAKDGAGKRKRTPVGEVFRQMSHRELVALDAVQGQLDEARSQLQGYQQTLEQKYGDSLKLRTYAVVGVGFERLVWKEVTR